jgi:hypothetical protein
MGDIICPRSGKEKACYQAAAKTGHNTEQCKTLWERTTTDPVALFTLVLSIATVGLWVATLDGIRRQSNETKILQRAYLGTELRGLRNMNGNVIAHVAFVNRGNLPARKSAMQSRLAGPATETKRNLRKSKSSIRALSSCCRRLKQNGERERFPLPTSLNLKLTRGSYMSGAGSNTTMDLVASRDG